MCEPLTARRLTLCESMYAAWCERRKTKTRRVIVPQPHGLARFVDLKTDLGYPASRGKLWAGFHLGPHSGSPAYFGCPYGPVGTPLAICEPFRVLDWYDAPEVPKGLGGRGGMLRTAAVEYKWGDGGRLARTVPESHWGKPTSQRSERLHSPRFMPVWAARRWTRLTSVGVERVQDIQTKGWFLDNLRAEGCLPSYICGGEHAALLAKYWIPLWDRLNAKRGYPWAANPWNWVLGLAEPGEENDRG